MSKAVIIRLRLPGENEQDTSLSLDELEALLSTLHIPVKTRTVQARHAPCSRFYFGSGKVDELKELIQDQGADLLAVDNTLSATQQRNISNAIGCEVRDRTAIILEIFSRRARSHEGKLQVEIAQLRYALTMLTGKGKSMSRQAGGIGTRRGIGETQLELDRRRIRDRLAILGKRLHEVTKMRFTQRKVRKKSGLPVVSLVGYTNAGKSTLLKALSGQDAFISPTLFATLDTSVRKIVTPDRFSFLLTDTVGFIRNLPTFLVRAFQATLEEINEADLILNVLDASDPARRQHEEATLSILTGLGALSIPRITVYNKSDLLESGQSDLLKTECSNRKDLVLASASEGRGLGSLLKLIRNRLTGSRNKETL